MPRRLDFARPDLVVDNPVTNLSLRALLLAPFDDKHAQLGGAPGARLTDGAPEPTGTGSRLRYQHGTIYRRADGGCAYVYGAIGARYDELCAGASWLGMPVTDEEPFSEGGRATRFENGAIYWWPDTGAIDLNHVVVHYTGLYAFAETDYDRVGTSADEPYLTLGVVTPSVTAPAVRTKVYDDVDAGDSRPDLVELYRGLPEGMVVSVLLLESDEGDADKYRAAVTEGVAQASKALVDVIKGWEVYGRFVAPVAEELLKAIGPDIVDAINALIGSSDDVLGNTAVTLSAKQMVVLAARTPQQDHWGIGWKAETRGMTGQGGEYKAYFSLGAV